MLVAGLVQQHEWHGVARPAVAALDRRQAALAGHVEDLDVELLLG